MLISSFNKKKKKKKKTYLQPYSFDSNVKNKNKWKFESDFIIIFGVFPFYIFDLFWKKEKGNGAFETMARLVKGLTIK